MKKIKDNKLLIEKQDILFTGNSNSLPFRQLENFKKVER